MLFIEYLVHLNQRAARVVMFLTLFVLGATGTVAQSNEIENATPITATQIGGKISARDLGDPRLTAHFYKFKALPGDLTIIVESENLTGDVDLFTEGSLRPLTKFVMYGGSSATSATKSVFLRKKEELLLRIEARSSGEGDGQYRIQLGGTFVPSERVASTEADSSSPATEFPNRTEKKTRRVSSVGAKLVEEAPAAQENDITLIAIATKNPPPTESELPTSADPVKPESAAPKASPRKATRTVARPPRSRPPRSPASTRSARTLPSTDSINPSRPAAKASTRSMTRAGKPSASPPQPQPTGLDINTRLVLETRGGAKIEHDMRTVRRVAVEKGEVVIVTKDGKVERHSTTNLVKMSIEP